MPVRSGSNRPGPPSISLDEFRAGRACLTARRPMPRLRRNPSGGLPIRTGVGASATSTASVSSCGRATLLKMRRRRACHWAACPPVHWARSAACDDTLPFHRVGECDMAAVMRVFRIAGSLESSIRFRAVARLLWPACFSGMLVLEGKHGTTARVLWRRLARRSL